jgi:voltage-gated potassium channel
VVEDEPWRRLRLCLALVTLILAGGTVGYRLLDFTWLDALYQTVTTVTTVGFREVEPLDSGGKVFTIVLILVGVGTILFAFTVLLETIVEGHLARFLGRRRMERRLGALHDHVVICGWGRVGREVARFVAGSGRGYVVIDGDAERVATVEEPWVLGDAREEAVLRQAGIDRARALVSAVTTDADNLYITLTARSLAPSLFIVARARTEASEPKLAQAGADRVVNPQRIGGGRMAAFALQPHVAEFLDVVMHDGSLEFRLEEVPVPDESSLAGRTLRDAHIRDRTGALVLATRDGGGQFTTNPGPDTVIRPGDILIAVGTQSQLAALVDAARHRA